MMLESKLLLKSTEQTLTILKNKYQEEYNETITDLNNFIQDMDTIQNKPARNYTEDEIYEILGYDTIKDYCINIIEMKGAVI